MVFARTEHEPENAYPIAVLIDELKSDDAKNRLNSVKRLGVIAKALGPDRTRNELVPFLNDSMDDDDDVLCALAEELGAFVPLVGGPPHVAGVLTTLESLCSAEESLVRDKAVSSLSSIAKQLPVDLLQSEFMSLVRRLASSDWATARSACCSVLHVPYQAVSESFRKELRDMCGRLCKDQEPMVRRAASNSMKQYAGSMNDLTCILTFLIPLFDEQSKDEQDSVRVLAVESAVYLGRAIAKELIIQYIWPVVKKHAQDKSWRVRYMLADQLPDLLKLVVEDPVRSDVIQIFHKLVTDQESEVRTAIACKVYDFCALLPKEVILKDITPSLSKLTDDKSQHVRAAFASIAMKLAQLLGKNGTIETLVPIFNTLLKDEQSDVRLNIISRLDSLNSVIGLDLLSQHLMPAVKDLCNDKNWRIRLAIVNEMPSLAAQLGTVFFDEHLNELSVKWMTDRVFEIRVASTQVMRRLVESFGQDWARQKLLPKLQMLSKDKNYLYRMIVLFTVQELSTCISKEALQGDYIALIMQLADDTVPNIRFVACKTFGAVLAKVDAAKAKQIQDKLRKMHNDDNDSEVRFFAARALATNP